MSTKQRKIYRYGENFKMMVVKELEEGSSVLSLQKKYGIKGGQTIQNWVRKFGKYNLLNKIVRVENLKDRNRMKELEEENKKLKIALAEAYMAKDLLGSVIKMADKEYETDLKKNFGDQLPKNGNPIIK